jgi:hypothetical protein
MTPAEEIAREAREAIERWVAGAVAEIGLPSDTARGLCNLSASYLHHQLKAAGYEPRLVQGVVHCDSVDSRQEPFLAAAAHRDAVHYWVEVGDDVYDISADQFNYRLDDAGFSGVLVGPAAALARHHACSDVPPFVPDDGDWASAFARERSRLAAEN